MRPTAPLLLLSTFAPSAFAWGRLGHDTVAFIAQNYVSPRTERWAQGLLKDSSDQYLANVSVWADSYRNEDEGAFSAPFHYISALDNSPPRTCTVDFERDCTPDGCVVSAIANYTRRVRDRRLDDVQRDYALRFLVHFVGDIHQPLHNEGYERGANGVFITFNNVSRNLHATWDTQIPDLLRAGYSRENARRWADHLIERIDGGVYAKDVRGWRRSVNPNDGFGSALGWSREANGHVCGFVAPQGWDALTGDLATNGYYDRAVPSVELQIARAGVRLAALLDGLSGKRKRDYEEETVDLSGRDLLPENKIYTPEQLRRKEEGFGCGCGEHDH